MLGSITPLGERGRGRVWIRSATALTLGGAVGGGTAGVLLGSLGAASNRLLGLDSSTRLLVLGLVLSCAAMLDLQRRVPTVHRQVNEDWLYSYRDWVYGLAFGFQLGVGGVTIVTSAAVYATALGIALTASPFGGALIGGLFGVVRAGTVFLGRRVTTPAQAARLDATVNRWAERARGATIAILLVLSAGTITALGLT